MAVDKNKIVFMNTILKNPTLSRRISEAWEAPIGSTRRAQVRDMVSSLKRASTNKNNDGQGGPGVSNQNEMSIDPFKKLLNQPYDPYSAVQNVDIKTPAPAVKITTVKTKPTTKPGASQQFVKDIGAGIKNIGSAVVNRVEDVNKEASLTRPEAWLNPSQVKGMKDYLQYVATQSNKNIAFGSVDANMKKPSEFGMPVHFDSIVSGSDDPYDTNQIETLMGNYFRAQGTKKMEEDKKAKESMSKSPVISPSNLTNLNKPQGPSTKSGASPASNASSSTDGAAKSYKTVDEAIQALKPGKVSLMINGQYAYMNMDGSIHVGKQGDNYIDPASSNQAPVDTAGADNHTTQTGSETETQDTVPLVGADKTIQDAVNSGVGSERFFNTVMSDKQKLIDLIGEDAANEFGDSPFLSQQVADLTKTLKQNNNLDKLAEQKKEMISRGGTLVSDLTDYIDGRDTYLEDIDKSIDNIKKETLMAADPFSRKQGSKYLDFLYLMRGRQNQRYIDLLNTGITRYNQDLTNLSNEVTDATNRYTEELASETAITTEKYNYIKTYLTGLYDKVANAPQLAANAEYANLQMDKAYIDQAKSLLDLKKTEQELNGGNSADDFKAFKEANDSGLVTDQLEDKSLSLKDGDVISHYKVLMNTLGTPAKTAKAVIETGLKNKIKNAQSSDELMKIKDQVMQLAGINDMSNEEEVSGFLEMINNTASGFKPIIASSAKNIRTALEDLTGEDLGGPVDPADAKAKSKWYSAYSSIDKTILDMLWNIYGRNFYYTEDKTRIFKPKDKSNVDITDLSDTDITNLLSSQIGELWRGEVKFNQ